MALMRVYCGLAASEPVGTQTANEWLTAAVVDDAGRLLDVCDFGDDAIGYAELGALLAERSGGGGSVAVATDSDEHHVTLLLAAAGRPLAIVDDETLTDYADRFADDESPDEIDAGPAERQAVGLARALAAGALAASSQAAPRELMALKPVLAAHAAVATGRHGTAVALREVLRELYPAALRAYPDPAEPIPLAILDALPEPGLLGTTSVGRGRDAAVANELAAAGIADASTISDAITALRVAIAETPRRTGVGKGTTTAVAETIREAVAAVRACDAAIGALVGLLSETVSPSSAIAPVHMAPAQIPPAQRAPAQIAPAQIAAARVAAVRAAPVRPAARTAPPEPLEAPRTLPRRGRTTVPIAAAPVAAAPLAPAPSPLSRAVTRSPATRPPAARPSPRPVAPAAAHVSAPPAQSIAPPAQSIAPPAQSVPPPPPGMTPIFPAQAPPGRVTAQMPPAPPVQHVQMQYAEPPQQQIQPQSAPAQQAPAQPTPRRVPTQYAPVQQPPTEHMRIPVYEPSAQPAAQAAPAPVQQPMWTTEPAAGYTPATYRSAHESYEQPAARDNYESGYESLAYPMSPEVGAPGSRQNWPLNPPSFDDDAVRARPGAGYEQQAPAPPQEAPIPRQRDGRVAPPWQSDEIPVPMGPPAIRHLDRDLPPAPPALRLVGPDEGSTPHRLEAPLDRSPYGGNDYDEVDGDLLIFAQARSAWFEWPAETEAEVEPERPAWTDIDAGWSMAARVEHPEVSGQTDVGLPRRVPAANLVPGSPLPPMTDQSLRIVRDPASMAAHTTGYFRGSRRGEEVRGYAVGGRTGRESGGGWDFSRDGWDSDRDTGYRSAAHR